MNNNDISEMIKASMEGVSSLANVDSAIGRPILTPSGTTIIPVSKISFALVNGGLDLGTKKMTSTPGFGCAGGTGASVTPLGFLIVDPNSNVQLIPLTESASALDRAIDIIEKAPEMIQRLRENLS